MSLRSLIQEIQDDAHFLSVAELAAKYGLPVESIKSLIGDQQ